MVSICVVAGEASGDIQGALLIKALKEEITQKKISATAFWGSVGPHMRHLGVEDIVK